jgi:hypothetical protein
MPISHISLATGPRHFAAMRSFYLTVLAPLGYEVYYDKADFMLGLMPKNGAPDFWIHVGNGDQAPFSKDGDVSSRPGRTHVAFNAESTELVDRWFETAM